MSEAITGSEHLPRRVNNLGRAGALVAARGYAVVRITWRQPAKTPKATIAAALARRS